MTVTGSRALGALMLVSGILVALFALCCAVDSDHHDDVHLAVAASTVHVDGGHDVDDCDHALTVVSAPSTAVPAPVPAAVALVVAVDAPATAEPVSSTSAVDRSPPLGPVPHLLCVLRT